MAGLEALLSLALIIFFGRILVFIFHTYPRLWVGGVFGVTGVAFHFVGRSFAEDLDFWVNHLFLIAGPLVAAVVSTYIVCLLLLRGRSIHYSWQGGTLTLYQGREQIVLQRQDILSVSSMIHPVAANWINPFKFYKIKTTKGTFYFDEWLENKYWDAASKVPFWSYQGGMEQAARNASFKFGEARASAYFRST